MTKTTLNLLTRESNDAARAIVQHIESEYGITLHFQTCMKITAVIQRAMAIAQNRAKSRK